MRLFAGHGMDLVFPVEGVHPVRPEIIDQEHHAARSPGDGVSPEDRFNHGERLHRQGDIGYAQDAPARRA